MPLSDQMPHPLGQNLHQWTLKYPALAPMGVVGLDIDRRVTSIPVEPRSQTYSKSKSGSTLSQKTLEDRGSVKLLILLGELTCWLLIFYTSANYAQLLIAQACMQNGNRMVNGSGKTLFGQDRTEWNVTVFLAPTVHQHVHVHVQLYLLEQLADTIYVDCS